MNFLIPEAEHGFDFEDIIHVHFICPLCGYHELVGKDILTKSTINCRKCESEFDITV